MVSKLIQIQIQVQIHPPWGPNLHHLIQGLSISTASKPSLDPYAACPDLISPSVVTLPPHWCVTQLSLKPALVTLESVISLVTIIDNLYTSYHHNVSPDHHPAPGGHGGLRGLVTAVLAAGGVSGQLQDLHPVIVTPAPPSLNLIRDTWLESKEY